jgi:hypothetical protein
MEIKNKQVWLLVIIIAGIVLYVTFMTFFSRSQVKYMQRERDSMRNEMLVQHHEESLITDSLRRDNRRLSDSLVFMDFLMINLNKKYEEEKKKHQQNINEVYSASDSATILWFNSIYPRK